MDPFLILGLVVYATMGSILLAGVWLSKRELAAIKVQAIPLMAKANDLLTPETIQTMKDLQMVPATITVGMERVLKAQLETPGSPLRAFTSALITEGTSALEETLAKRFEGLSKLLPAAATLVSKAGNDSKVDKKEGREAVAALMESFGPAAKIIEKFVPMSKREDPIEFLAYLAKAKQQISAFVPDIGAMLDSQLAAALGGALGGEAAPAGLFQITTGITGTGKAQPTASADSYMRA